MSAYDVETILGAAAVLLGVLGLPLGVLVAMIRGDR